jgi:Domain of unknown function (DUF4307)
VSEPDSLSERYGAPSPIARRALLTGVVAVAAAFLGWLAWTAIWHGDPDATSDLVTFTVDGEHQVTARVDVRLDDEDVVASCVLQAVAEDHTVVGELRFEVRASDLEGDTVLERRIRTERRATSVDPVGCTTEDQQRPR